MKKEETIEVVRDNFEDYLRNMTPWLFDTVVHSFTELELKKMRGLIYGNDIEKCREAASAFIKRTERYIS